MSESSQAACSCARAEYKPLRHNKLTLDFKICKHRSVICRSCAWLHKKEFYLSKHLLCKFQLHEKEQGTLALECSVEIFGSKMSGNCTSVPLQFNLYVTF